MSREALQVLFVCTGNICRSPTAQGVFEQLVREAGLQSMLVVDSAGLSRSHVGQAPDPRTQKAAKDRGVDLSKQRARKVVAQDFLRFDYIVAMDSGHYEDLSTQHAELSETRAQVVRLLDFCVDASLRDVPDPYYGPIAGFARVFDVVELGCRDFLQHLRVTHGI